MCTSPEGSITQIYTALAAGDESAARKLWERYYDELLRHAAHRLRGMHAKRRAADEEDVVLDSFEAFIRAAADGRYPDLHGRDAIWATLLTIAGNRAKNLVRGERAAKRGDDTVRGESVFAVHPMDSCPPGLENASPLGAGAPMPSPEYAAIVADELDRVYRTIDSTCQRRQAETMKRVLRFKLQGYSNREVADAIECSERTVERAVGLIRSFLAAEAT